MKKHSTTRYITLAIFILASIITGIGVNMQDLPLCDVIICILGLLATTYVVYFVTFFFLEKIHRDVILVKENYLVWVLLLVLAMPFVFASIPTIYIGYGRMGDAIDMFNLSQTTAPQAYWTIQGSQNGLGLALHF